MGVCCGHRFGPCCNRRSVVCFITRNLCRVSSILRARGLACAAAGAAATQVLPPVQVPDDAFAFPVDPDFVPPPNAASQVAQADMAALLVHAAAVWKERQERHAVIVPALQAGGDTSAWRTLCAPSLQSVQRHSECWMFRDAVVPATVPTLRHLELRRLSVGYLAVGVRVTMRDAHAWCALPAAASPEFPCKQTATDAIAYSE